MIWFSVIMTAAAICLGVSGDIASRSGPTPIPKPARATRSYTIVDFIASTPVATPRLVVAPLAVSKPTYDNTPIPDALDDPDGNSNCAVGNGCAIPICHYDEDAEVGYSIAVGPRERAAHLAQHPNDYGDNTERMCNRLTPEEEPTPRPARKPRWHNNEVDWNE
jgi:hypothetical protein